MRHLIFAATALLIFTAGCYHYDPQFEGPYQDGDTPQATTIPFEILTVEDGRIHLYHKLLQYDKTLDNLPPGIQKAAINYAHDRIAYQIPGKNIAVVDTAGVLLGTVGNSAGADWFDWHANDRSLCILDHFQLSTWGDPLIPVVTDLSQFFPFGSDEQEMRCATVTADGSVVVAYRDFAGFFTGYECKIVVISSSGSMWEKWISSSAHINWMRVDRSGKNLLFGVTTGFSDPEIWLMDVDALSADYRFDANFCVFSPGADRFAVWSPGELRSTSQSTGDAQTFSTGTATVSALDW